MFNEENIRSEISIYFTPIESEIDIKDNWEFENYTVTLKDIQRTGPDRFNVYIIHKNKETNATWITGKSIGSWETLNKLLYVQFPIFEQSKHRELWDWLSKNPSQHELDWPKWPLIIDKCCTSFACDTAEKIYIHLTQDEKKLKQYFNFLEYQREAIYKKSVRYKDKICQCCPLWSAFITEYPEACLCGLYREYDTAKMKKDYATAARFATIIRDLPINKTIPNLLIR